MLRHAMQQKLGMRLACQFEHCDALELLLIDSRLDVGTPLRKSVSGSNKRKTTYDTPPVPKFSKADGMSSPSDGRNQPSKADQNGAQYPLRPRAN